MMMPMTELLARAAATDAGNRQMRTEGRTAWSLRDFQVATAEYLRLWPPDRPAAILGRTGGSARSDRKAASSRANGAKGGRPKRTP